MSRTYYVHVPALPPGEIYDSAYSVTDKNDTMVGFEHSPEYGGMVPITHRAAKALRDSLLRDFPLEYAETGTESNVLVSYQLGAGDGR